MLFLCIRADESIKPLLTQDTANILENTPTLSRHGNGTVYGPEDWTYTNVNSIYTSCFGAQNFHRDMTVMGFNLSSLKVCRNLFPKNISTSASARAGRNNISELDVTFYLQ